MIKVKLSFCFSITSWRCMGEWKYSPTHSWKCHCSRCYTPGSHQRGPGSIAG